MTSNYTPLVARTDNSFNKYYSPDPKQEQSILVTDLKAKEVLLASSIGQNSNLQWRTFLPPGTKVFEASLFTYSNPVETRISAKFGSPPTATVDQVDLTASNSFLRSEALEKLLSGSELLYFNPLITYPNGKQSGSGTTRLSAKSEEPNPPISSVGGWVYFNTMQSAGDVIKNIDVRVTVDMDCYNAWFAQAKFDVAGNPIESVVHASSTPTRVTNVVEFTEPDGTLTLKFNLEPSTSEQGQPLNFWAAGLLPAASGLVAADTLFFRCNSVWEMFKLPNFELPEFNKYKFSTIFNTNNTNNIINLVVPLGLSKTTLRLYGVSVYVGYQTGSNPVCNLGVIWQ